MGEDHQLGAAEEKVHQLLGEVSERDDRLKASKASLAQLQHSADRQATLRLRISNKQV